MNMQNDCIAELHELLEGLVEQQLTADEKVRLNALLAQDPINRRYYRDFCRLHWDLMSQVARRPLTGRSQKVCAPARYSLIRQPLTMHRCRRFRPFAFLSRSGSRSSFGYLRAWHIPLAEHSWRLDCSRSGRGRCPRLAAFSRSHTANRRRQPRQVGVISGATDCRWADASTAIEPETRVAIGRRFVLASGLLQIWYDSSVEVLLQGPAIFEVDSRNGGFLSLGRLTARVEKTRETDGDGGRVVPPPRTSPFARPPPSCQSGRHALPRPSGLLGVWRGGDRPP